MGRQSLSDKVANWIDTDVIADLIISHIKNELHEKPTFDKAKEVWYNELEQLGAKIGG